MGRRAASRGRPADPRAQRPAFRSRLGPPCQWPVRLRLPWAGQPRLVYDPCGADVIARCLARAARPAFPFPSRKNCLTQGAGSVRRLPSSPDWGGSRGPAAMQGRLRGPAPVPPPLAAGGSRGRWPGKGGERCRRRPPACRAQAGGRARSGLGENAGGGLAHRAPPRCGARTGRLGRRRELPGVACAAARRAGPTVNIARAGRRAVG